MIPDHPIMQSPTDATAEMRATVRSIAARTRRLRALRARMNGAWDRLWSNPQRRTTFKKRAARAGGAIALAVGVILYFLLRPYPQPDYSTAGIDELFNFTLMKDEFNRLPIQKRLELLAMLRERIQKMGAGESALLAAFAAGIGGQARDQLEENISKLMVDLWDQYAADYPRITDADRAAYLDSTFISLARAMQTVAGDTPRESDDELLAHAKSDAQRDQKAIESGHGPDGRALGRIFGVLNNGVAPHASPEQRSRGQVMMRDMVRQMRGEDLASGKPLR